MDKEKYIEKNLFDSLNDYESALPAGGWDGLVKRKAKKRRKTLLLFSAALFVFFCGFSFLLLEQDKNNTQLPGNNKTSLQLEDHGQSLTNSEPNNEKVYAKKADPLLNKENEPLLPSKEMQKAGKSLNGIPTIIETSTGQTTLLTPVQTPDVSGFNIPGTETLPLMAAHLTTSIPKMPGLLIPFHFKMKHRVNISLYAEAGLGRGRLTVGAVNKGSDPGKSIVGDSSGKNPQVSMNSFEIGIQFHKGNWSAGIGLGNKKLGVLYPGSYSTVYDSILPSVINVSGARHRVPQHDLPQFTAFTAHPWIRFQQGRRLQSYAELGLQVSYLTQTKGSLTESNFFPVTAPGKFSGWNWSWDAGAGISYPIYNSARAYLGYSYQKSVTAFYTKDNMALGYNIHQLKLKIDLPLRR